MKAYKCRLYPKKDQIEKINPILNLSYKLYNAMLEQRKMAYELKKDFHSSNNVNYLSQQNELPELKKYFPEYREIYSLSLQDVARRLDKAYDIFFRRIKEKKNGRKIKAGFPRFKSRKSYKSITYMQSGFKIGNNNNLQLSKLGTMRMFTHRKINGTIKGVTLKDVTPVL